MAHALVRIIRDDDGDLTFNNSWHFVDPHHGGLKAYCTGEFFGFAESSAEYETKTVNRGGITCPSCQQLLRYFKAVRL